MAFTAGQKLRAADLNGGPRVVAWQGTTQNLPDATGTAITFGSELLDTHSIHSTGTNPSRFTPTVAGWYRCWGQVCFAISSVGNRAAHFRKNGAVVNGGPYAGFPAPGGSDVAPAVPATGMIYCNGTTDYIELYGYQSSGGTLATFSSSGTYSMVEIHWYAD